VPVVEEVLLAQLVHQAALVVAVKAAVFFLAPLELLVKQILVVVAAEEDPLEQLKALVALVLLFFVTHLLSLVMLEVALPLQLPR